MHGLYQRIFPVILIAKVHTIYKSKEFAMSPMIQQSQPVFAAGTIPPDSYYVFEKRFTVNIIDDPVLEIAADSTFELFINGKLVPIQQLADFPDSRTFSQINIAEYLQCGSNIIRCNVHYIGDAFLTYQPGVPFLQLIAYQGNEVLVKTDLSWRCAPDSAYTQNLQCKLTRQLGFVYEYNADAPAVVCDQAVAIAPVKGTLELRKVPQLNMLPAPETFLHSFGVLKRDKEEESFALSCMRDFCAPRRIDELFAEFDRDQVVEIYTSKRFKFVSGKEFAFKPLDEFPGCDGYYVIVDLQKESTGYITLDLTAPAGTVIDIMHGEHLDDGRVRSFVGFRNFTDRYHCTGGRNVFTTLHRRYGCRYIELHITNVSSGRVALNYVGMNLLEVPLSRQAEFFCEDSMILAHNQLAVDTLKLCMHEHYEDCPWREQGLYGYDSRNQMLFGYYVWGNFEFAAAALDLLGRSYDGERYLTLTAPGTVGRSIPVFTMAWITAIYEHMMFSGSRDLFNKYQAQIDAILDRALSEKAPGCDELYAPGNGPKIWNFYEWCRVMSHMDEQLQSPYNLYLAEALQAAGAMHKFTGSVERGEFLQATSEKIIKAVKKYFFDPALNGIKVTTGNNELFEHVQALYLTHGELESAELDALLDKFDGKSMHELTFSAFFYYLRGLRRHGERARSMLLPRLRKTFDPILLAGATSLWETADGSFDFDCAGSLCHAWSSVYPYFCGSILLGVKPLEPGFARFEVSPVSCGLTHAEGEVPTPQGMIKVSWHLDKDQKMVVTVQKPCGLQCVISENIQHNIFDC